MKQSFKRYNTIVHVLISFCPKQEFIHEKINLYHVRNEMSLKLISLKI